MKPIRWYPELNEQLRVLRVERGLSWRSIEHIMGFSYTACREQGIALGFSKRRVVPVAEIAALRARGHTFRAISKALGIYPSNACKRYHKFINSAASRAASEVGHGPDAAARVAALPTGRSSPNLGGAASRGAASFGREAA